MIAQTEMVGHLGEARGRDEVGFDLRLLPFRVGRKRAEQRVAHDQAQHRIAEELERFVVGHTAARILVRLGLVRQRVLEQAAIAEAVANPCLERVELLRQRHDDAAADLFAMALDDADGMRGIFFAHRDLGFAERCRRERQHRTRSRGAQGLDAVAVEQRLDDVGFDVGLGAEDHREAGRGHAGAAVLTDVVTWSIVSGVGASIFMKIIVMSSC